MSDVFLNSFPNVTQFVGRCSREVSNEQVSSRVSSNEVRGDKRENERLSQRGREERKGSPSEDGVRGKERVAGKRAR